MSGAIFEVVLRQRNISKRSSGGREEKISMVGLALIELWSIVRLVVFRRDLEKMEVMGETYLDMVFKYEELHRQGNGSSQP